MKRIRREDLPRIIDEAFDNLRAPIGPGEAFVHVCEAIARAEGKPNWIEKTPRHVNWADRIMEGLPETRFVVMVREPYGFMLSYKYQGARKREDLRRAFGRRYHPLGCALIWRANMRAALRLVERHPDRALLVRLEDVERDGPTSLAAVQEFLRLEPCRLVRGLPRRENTSFGENERPELEGAEIFWINLLARSEIERGGFQRRTESPDLLSVARSILSLPGWASHALSDIQERTEGSTLRYILRWLFPS